MSQATAVSDLERSEHDNSTKKVSIYGEDSSGNYVQVSVDADGRINIGNGLVPENYDYVALTYVVAGNGVGEIETVVYKSGGSGGTTEATLTLAYNSDNEISSITKV